jgi:hypothetical protein
MKKRKGSPSTWFYSEAGKENHARIFGKSRKEDEKADNADNAKGISNGNITDPNNDGS